MIERIGRYEVQAEIGRGGFGRVYRAFDPTVGRLVAIKTLNAGGDPELLTRFRNEAAAAGKLRHRNIIVIHDYGEQNNEPYIVMELLDGEDLHRMMRNHRALSLLQKVQIMAQVADGLDHAHRNSVLHRDVKPANIMLLPDFTVKIMDFGIALVTQAAELRLTKSGTVPGTLKYMSPEQFRGAADNAASDIFAYGVTFYELLCGQHPFDGPSQHAVMFNIVQSEPKRPHELCAECSDALEQIVLTCLNKTPEMRYPSFRDLQFDMKPILIELQQEHAKGLLAEAERLAGAGQAEGAQALLRETLEIDPGNRAARALREKVQRILRAQIVEPRVKQPSANEPGRDQGGREQTGQLPAVPVAPEIDPLNQDARAAQKRLEIISRLIREVNTLVGVRNFERAIQMLEIGLGYYPGERTIEDRLSAVRAAKAARLRDEDLEKSTLSQPERNLTAATNRGPVGDVQKQFANPIAADIERLISQSQPAAAIAAAENALAQHPGDPALQALLFRAQELRRLRQRTETVAKVLSQVDELMITQKFGPAMKLIEEGLQSFSGDAKLTSARESVLAARSLIERKQAVDKAVAEARALLDAEQVEQVIALCQPVLDRYPDESKLATLVSQAKAHLHHRELRRHDLQRIERDVRAQIDSGNPDGALQLIEQGRRQFPEATSLLEMFEQARRMKLRRS